ncbi:MAG TPA: hypothetical protein VK146_10465 [Tabrizicola sp.]|nr:hypothetical protein [Tabrizicola sp.]
MVDLKENPAGALEALNQGREFLEGLDVMDAAFMAWLREERERVAAELRPDAIAEVPSFGRRLAGRSSLDGPQFVQDLGAEIARLTAEYLLRAVGEAVAKDPLPHGLDLQVEGAWSADRAQLRVRLVAQTNQQTLWSQKLVASRAEDLPSVVLEAVEAA